MCRSHKIAQASRACRRRWAGDCGKGANVVVSQLHYCFEYHGLGEKEAFLHADNCTGENKNSCMIQYLAWHTMTYRHTKLTLTFLVVGYTDFAPDWCLSLFKRLHQRTRFGTLKDIAQVANTSAQCKFAMLASREDGSSIVPIYYWTTFFCHTPEESEGIKNCNISSLIPPNLIWTGVPLQDLVR